MNSKVQELITRGAVIHGPESVWISDDVELDKVADNITIFPGCRISGAETSIGPLSSLGQEAPATVENCQLADNVSLKGGYFSGATFLSGVSFGSCAHVRPGTLLEEEASCAHSVGLKQTLLFPYVTLGSLINFCDCFMSGGTSRKNHSEVGSSFIHFNYTPHQDKATPSLVGDVPRGVMLDQPPIFLGGQGGLVGPAVIEYGAIAAAGTINRKDILEPGKLVYEKSLPKRYEIPYQPGAYGEIARIVANNMKYIGNLKALLLWYRHVRSHFQPDIYAESCFNGAVRNLESMLSERIKRMEQLAKHMPRSLKIAEERLGLDSLDKPYSTQKRFQESWPLMSEKLSNNDFDSDSKEKELAVNTIVSGSGKSSYIESIINLDSETKKAATIWLSSVVDAVTELWHN